MSYVHYNANPVKNRTGDCVIRAISTVENRPWLEVYYGVTAAGAAFYSMPDSNEVWGEYLRLRGYSRGILPNTCPDHCYTVYDFCRDNPRGKFILAMLGHVVAVIDGDWYDTFDSGDEVPLYYWYKREET